MREPVRLRLGLRIASVAAVALLALPACNQAEKIRAEALADSQAVTFYSEHAGAQNGASASASGGGAPREISNG